MTDTQTSAPRPAAQTARDLIEVVRSGAGLRLYSAIAESHSMLAEDGQPDHRVPVPLT